MLPVEPPPPEAAGAPAALAGRTKDEPLPPGPQTEPTGAITPEGEGDAAAAGEYEPL